MILHTAITDIPYTMSKNHRVQFKNRLTHAQPCDTNLRNINQ